jgi:hypothetical protein
MPSASWPPPLESARAGFLMDTRNGEGTIREREGCRSRPAPTSRGLPILAARARHPSLSGRRTRYGPRAKSLRGAGPILQNPPATRIFARMQMSPKFRTGKPLFQSNLARTDRTGPASPRVLVDGMASPVRLNGPLHLGHSFIASSEKVSAPDPSPPKSGSSGCARNQPAFTNDWVVSGLTAVCFLAAALRRERGYEPVRSVRALDRARLSLHGCLGRSRAQN